MVRSLRAQRAATRTFIYVVGLLVGFLFLFPFLWMVLCSLKYDQDIMSIPLRILPPTWNWSSYREAFVWPGFDFLRYIINTVFVTVGATALCLASSTTAGYGFAKYSFRGNAPLFILILSTMMIPFQATMIPLFILIRNLGLQNTFTGLIIPLGLSAFGIFMMRQFFYSVPNEFIEAARMDGASELGIFVRISLPMARTSALALTIFHAQAAWNVLLWPLIVISKPSMRTLPQAIALFTSSYMTNYAQQLAVCVVACLPLLLLYVFFSKYFISGIALGGIKG
jgi:ABC-type glycerol-3-phosphate transport system permease component